MKPIKLTINSFGPFADTQIIDFTALWEYNIFLITGTTGAGKTTVFDALTFALYGDASGDTRQTENFKSDYAEDTDICSVELEFLLKNNIYKIKRAPKQIKITRNNTTSFMSESAELTLDDGTILTGIKEVDAKVEELLGLNKRQFNQIVMLPQGEFRKLIEAPSGEKQEIFRKIFKTDIYNQICEMLGVKSKDIEKQLDFINERIKSTLSSINAEDDSELKELIQADYIDIPEIVNRIKEKNLLLKKEYTVSFKELEIKNKEIESINLQNAIDVNKKLDQFKLLEEQWNDLNLQKKQYESLENELKLYKSALSITTIRNSLQEKESLLNNTQNKAKQAESEFEKQIKIFEAINKDYLTLDSLSETKNQALKTTLELKNNLSVCDKLEHIKQNIISLEDRTEKRLQTEARLNLLLQRSECKEAYDHVALLENEIIECGKLTAELKRALDNHENIVELYNRKYNDYISTNAIVIASTLENGKPCPVCGSLNHPNKAQNHNCTATKEDLEKLSQQKEMQANIINQLKSKLMTAINKLEQYEIYIVQNELQIEEILKQLRIELEKARGDKNLHKQKYDDIHAKCCEFLSSNLIEEKYCEKTIITEEANKIKSEIHAIKSQIEVYKENLDSITQTENLKYASREQVIHELKVLTEEIQSLDAKIKLISTNYLKEKERKDKLEQSINSYEEYIETLNHDILVKRTEFTSALLNSSFSDETEYLKYVKDINDINALEQSILKFNDNYKITQARYHTFLEDIKDKSYFNIEELKARILELENNRKVINEHIIKIKTTITINEKTLKELDSFYYNSEKLIEDYKDIGRLFKVANGSNSQKLSFERYILAAYFDEIIASANIRFNKMTNFRYFLKRKEEKEKHGRASGLDLEIIDTYTGKDRHINTLSGGESFKAALSLALGLADVVQSNSAGVEISTLFIDEGFGTLDPQSLDSAIDTLISLTSSGRLIGIISHVPDLKEKIRSRVEITSTGKGSIVSVIS